MAENLFKEFEHITSKQWKQQIQYELKGADYNENLVWESPEGIKVKPFYHSDEIESHGKDAGDKLFLIILVLVVIYKLLEKKK